MTFKISIIDLVNATADPCWDVVYLNVTPLARNKVSTYVQPAVLVDFKHTLCDSMKEESSGV